LRKRDETKAELKALLKKYVSQHNNNYCAQVVGLAQDEMDEMHTVHDKAVKDLNHFGE
jgi:hypothetical protein